MINLNVVQEAIVQHLKANVALVGMLNDKHQIKEDQWQGRTYSYPAIRVNLGRQTNYVTSGDKCSGMNQEFTVEVYSEKDSSMEANDIMFAVNTALEGINFTYGTIRFVSITLSVVNPPERIDDKTWRTSITYKNLIQTK